MPQENPAYTDAEKAAFRRHPETLERDARRDGARSVRRASPTRSSTRTRRRCRRSRPPAARISRTSVRDPGAAREAAPELPRGVQAPDHLGRLLPGDPAAERRARHRGHRARRAGRRAHARRPPARARRAGARHRLPRRSLRAPDAGHRPATASRSTTSGRSGPIAYLSISVPGFPNFFMLNGPNGPVGNFSLIEVAELQLGVRAAAGRAHARRRAAARSAPRDGRDAALRRRAPRGRPAHRSGRPAAAAGTSTTAALPTAWPWTFDRFREEMAAPRLADYELRRHR